jgi:hypothetical protein
VLQSWNWYVVISSIEKSVGLGFQNYQSAAIRTTKESMRNVLFVRWQHYSHDEHVQIHLASTLEHTATHMVIMATMVTQFGIITSYHKVWFSCLQYLNPLITTLYLSNSTLTGGIYVRLEHEWREANCHSHGYHGNSNHSQSMGWGISSRPRVRAQRWWLPFNQRLWLLYGVILSRMQSNKVAYLP